MEIEKLKKSNTKRYIIIGSIVVLILAGITLTFTKAKYKTTTSIPLVNGTINYDLSDLNLIGVYIQEGEEYVKTDTIPTSGYEFNSEESYCTVNNERDDTITLSFDMTTQNLTVTPLTKKGTKCYLYFDEKDICEGLTASECILAYEGGAEAIEAKGTPDFSQTATTDEGMYAAEDDYGTSYYYRGAVNDNWFQFGTNSSGQPLYWRIVRINGDGSVRLIYNGTSTATTGDSTMINKGREFNIWNDNSAYVGYMYKSGEVHGLTTNSWIKTELDKWYISNLSDEAKNLDGNAGFCGDRYPSTSSSSSNGSDYGAYIRLNTNKSPSFKCTDKDNDLYTTPGSSKGNGALKVDPNDEGSTPTPIGLITADEVAFAGGVYKTSNTSYYLYNNEYYWTMSPYGYYSGNGAFVFLVWSDGSLNSGRVDISHGVRPVINLKSAIAITGEGSVDKPFKIQ